MDFDWPIEPLSTAQGHRHTNNQSQGAAWGPLIYLSAVRGTDPVTGAVDSDIETQARQCFANLNDLLLAVGSGLERVLRIGMYMKDLRSDRPHVNNVWNATFGTNGPARFAVEVQDIGAPGDNSRLLLDVVAVRSMTQGGDPASARTQV